MEPKAGQRDELAQNAGCRRFIWNWELGCKQDYYHKNGVGLRTSVLRAELPILKRRPETAWLADADSQSLQETLRDLDRAFKNFFEGRGWPRSGLGLPWRTMGAGISGANVPAMLPFAERSRKEHLSLSGVSRAEIPFDLAQHIARCFRPQQAQAVVALIAAEENS
jgi:hypothetical protein